MAEHDRPRAVPVGGSSSQGGKGGKMGWLLLALLLVAVVIGLILILGGGDDDKPKAVQSPSTTATPASASPTKAAEASGDDGSLQAAGEPLLPASDGSFTSLVGQTAVGQRVVVQAVNRGGGFFVGTSEENRVYVEYGAKTGESEAGRFQPKVGDRVDLTGEARPAPRDPATALKLDAAGARLVTDQDGFVNAKDVQRAK